MLFTFRDLLFFFFTFYIYNFYLDYYFRYIEVKNEVFFINNRLTLTHFRNSMQATSGLKFIVYH